MKNNQSGFASILLVIIVLIGVGGGVYFYTKQKSEVKVEDTSLSTDMQSTTTVATTSEVRGVIKEDLSQPETFKKQPVKILSIKDLGNNMWSVQADVLTYNPDWTPGGHMGLYLNKNSKIRTLIISKVTKVNVCDNEGILSPSTANSLVSDIAKILKTGSEFILSMDIEGSKIVATYEKCSS